MNKSNRKILVAWLLVSSLVGSVRGEDKIVNYRFFEDGQSRYRIVLPEQSRPEEREAAELIKSIFSQIGDVAHDENNSGKLEIHIGNTPAGLAAAKRAELDKRFEDAFLIDPVSPECLVIIGNRPISTFYGAAEFLEQYAGVIWVWPHEDGMVIPRNRALRADVKKQISEPAFRERRISGVTPGWGRYNKMNQETRDRHEILYLFNHNINRVMPPAMFDTHPEYFNMLRGERRRPVRMQRQACTSNPEVVRLFIEAAKRQFKQYPWIHSFSVSANDGGNFCECEECRKLDIPGVPGNTDRYFTFANAVADGIREEYPDKLIACLAYGKETFAPPVKLQLRPNVIPYLVIPSLADVHADIAAWSRHCNQLGVYFHLHTKAVPKFYPGKFAEYMNFLKKHKVVAVYSEVYPEAVNRRASWEIDAPRLWILGKIWWDPETDVEKLLDTFCERFYGPAAAPMRRYFRQCENAWNRTANPYDFRRIYEAYEYDLYNAEDIRVMAEAFQDALRLAANDPAVSKRLERQRKVLYPVIAALQFEDFQAELSGVGDPRRILEALNRRAAKAAEFNPESPLKDIPNATASRIDELMASLRTKPGAQAPEFWREALDSYPLLAPFIKPQVETEKSIVLNPLFAKRKDGSLRSWSTWFRPNTDGIIEIDTTATGNDTPAVRFRNCIAASVNQSYPVRVGSRYRVSCRVKTQGTPAYLNVHGKTADGKWLGKADRYTAEADSSRTDWQQLTITVTIPDRSATMTVGMGVGQQKKSESAWFSDLKVVPLYTVPDK